MQSHRAFILAAGALALVTVNAAAQKPKKDRNVITAEEIAAAPANNAYEVVEKLRPEFLRRHPTAMTLGGGTRSQGVVDRGGTPGRAGGGDPAGSGLNPPSDGAPGAQGAELTVFVNGQQMGGVDELKRVSSNQIEEIRYLSGSAAEGKYGPRVAAGVIEVKLVEGR